MKDAVTKLLFKLLTVLVFLVLEHEAVEEACPDRASCGIHRKQRQQDLPYDRSDHDQAEDTYTDKEIFQLITMPGFSTKKEVTEYSGRGVGMDVVVSNLTFIGGSLEIESEKGIGSRMIIKIPLATACFMEA